MELKNKKIGFLGDSITEGCGVSVPENIFWNLLCADTGALCYGYGIGGTRIARQHQPSENANCDRFFASRIEDMAEDLDVIVVFGGTNDFGHGDAPLGNIHSQSDDTFYGAMHQLIQKLLVRYPEGQLVFLTPLHRLGEEALELNECGVRRVADLETYVNAVIHICGYYGIPVLDLFRTSGLQPEFPYLRQRYMPDGLHPNDAGHRKIADRLESFLRAL